MPSTLRHAEETLREELSASAMPLVSFANTVEDAVREADLVIDCVPDELESKLEIFSLLDRMAPPRTVFATPTTALSIADLARCTYRPGQCVGIAMDAKQLSAGPVSETTRRISIFTTTQTTSQAEKLVLSFWERLGYSPQVERDPSEAGLT